MYLDYEHSMYTQSGFEAQNATDREREEELRNPNLRMSQRQFVSQLERHIKETIGDMVEEEELNGTETDS